MRAIRALCVISRSAIELSSWDQAIQRLHHSGLNLFAATAIEDLPEEILTNFKDQGIPTKDYHSLILIGHGGRRFWQSLSRPITPSEHPIDQKSLKMMEEFRSQTLSSHSHLSLFPSANFLIPLQKLGRALNLSHPSAMGIDINESFGLWFAFRGVFLTSAQVPKVMNNAFSSPCLSCVERPCLMKEDFWEKRLACPYQESSRYDDEQISYHQSLAFKDDTF